MPQVAECFALDLVERFPLLGQNIDFYYDGPEDFLAHVFFGIEVTPEVVAAYVAEVSGVPVEERLNWRGVLSFLNRCLQSEDRVMRTVIGTSFLFQLPAPGQEGYGIVDELDDGLARLFEVARPNG
ncbi:hypothetical protein [Nocardiopsis ganjiahuensis]|uniref:hypothetical protein n=1 Tax=Nocardiopsis ganjiahuensis TaxID=239984 RepID=UPI0003758F80|nr:hypothetical protein [Nocardiopsis ganjiahuensis]